MPATTDLAESLPGAHGHFSFLALDEREDDADRTRCHKRRGHDRAAPVPDGDRPAGRHPERRTKRDVAEDVLFLLDTRAGRERGHQRGGHTGLPAQVAPQHGGRCPRRRRVGRREGVRGGQVTWCASGATPPDGKLHPVGDQAVERLGTDQIGSQMADAG